MQDHRIGKIDLVQPKPAFFLSEYKENRVFNIEKVAAIEQLWRFKDAQAKELTETLCREGIPSDFR